MTNSRNPLAEPLALGVRAAVYAAAAAAFHWCFSPPRCWPKLAAAAAAAAASYEAAVAAAIGSIFW